MTNWWLSHWLNQGSGVSYIFIDFQLIDKLDVENLYMSCVWQFCCWLSHWLNEGSGVSYVLIDFQLIDNLVESLYLLLSVYLFVWFGLISQSTNMFMSRRSVN